MNRHRKTRIITRRALAVVVLIFVFLPYLSWKADAAVPWLLAFRGRLTDGSGNLLGSSGTAHR